MLNKTPRYRLLFYRMIRVIISISLGFLVTSKPVSAMFDPGDGEPESSEMVEYGDVFENWLYSLVEQCFGKKRVPKESTHYLITDSISSLLSPEQIKINVADLARDILFAFHYGELTEEKSANICRTRELFKILFTALLESDQTALIAFQLLEGDIGNRNDIFNNFRLFSHQLGILLGKFKKSNEFIFDYIVSRYVTLYILHWNKRDITNKMEKLTNWLYKNYQASAEVQFAYANFCVNQEGMHNEKSLLKINKNLLKYERFQTAERYWKVGCYLENTQQNDFIEYYKKAMEKDNRSDKYITIKYSEYYMNALYLAGKYEDFIFASEKMLESYREIIKNLKELMKNAVLADGMREKKSLYHDFSERIKNINYKRINAYDKMGNAEKASDGLHELLKDTLANVALKKERLAIERQLQPEFPEKVAVIFPCSLNQTTNHSIKAKPKTSKQPKLEKKNTKKVLAEKKGASNPAQPGASMPQKKYIPIEQRLKGVPLKTFNRLFEHFDNGGYHDLKISMESFAHLIEALEQKFDRAGGNGSHTKVTFNEKFVENHKGKVEILSNKTHLLEYQIDMLVKIFCGYNLYPKYLEEILINKGMI